MVKKLIKFLLLILSVISLISFIQKVFVHTDGEKPDNKKNIQKQTGSGENLNVRQVKIIKLFNAYKSLTNGEIKSKVHGVTERTLRRDLTLLERLGLIKKIGKTKGSSYIKL